MTCPTGDGNTLQPGQSLCLDCIDRLYSELRWLAAMYPQLLTALTHRINVERVESVRVSGGKDPMVRGMDLHEDALSLRAEIRKINIQGLAWMMERGHTGVHLKSPEIGLRELGRDLHWILSDDDPDRILTWANRIILARQDSEELTTPDVPTRRTPTQQICGLDVNGEPCPGDLIIWGSDPIARCTIDVKHGVSRETLIYRLVKLNLQKGQ